AAVDFGYGTTKLLGPAGSGKTTALVERAASLVTAGTEPEMILFLVQDRRSTEDLRNRFVRRLGRSIAGPAVLTFHGFAWSLLTKSLLAETPDGREGDFGYQFVGLGQEPVLLTAFDQRALVRDLLADEDPKNWPVNGHMLGSNAFAGEIRDFMLRAQERLLDRVDLERVAVDRGRPDWKEVAGFLGRYLATLQDPASFDDGRPRVDFAGVLVEARRLLSEQPSLRTDLKDIYPHILVDDFEEANRAEASLLETLLPEQGEPRSVVIAADPEGSVFGFRGADPSCLDRFEFPVIEVAETYRRTSPPEVQLYSHLTEEARGIVGIVRSAWAGGTPWGDMAIIMRDYRNLLTPLRRELARAGVPVRIEGEALQLNDDPVVRPVLDLFSIACGVPGHEELWPGLLLSELGGLSTNEMTEVRRAARLARLGVAEVCGNLDGLELPGPVRVKLAALCDLLSRACEWAENKSPDECFWELWNNSSWFAELVAAEDSTRLDPLTTLADALARFTERRGREARMRDFIDTLTSAEFTPESHRINRSQDAVTITTAHGAKGREFELAIVAGCIEGMWPDPSRRGLLLDADVLDAPRSHGDRRRDALAEEYRLFKLATSRARRLVLTGERAGGSERTAVEPSRFLSLVVDELPTDNAEVVPLVLTAREAETAWRGVLQSSEADAADRLAALWGLATLPGIDPSRWWWAARWTENTTPVVGEYKKTSYSRFSDYENCPLEYLMGQVLGLDPETSYQMNYGRLVHGLFEDLEKGLIPADVDAAYDEAMNRWRDEEYPAGAISNFLKRDLREMIERFVTLELSNGHTSAATEYGFEFDVEGWRVRGKIDRIDTVGSNGLRLVDYKTGGYKRDPEAQEDLQLWTYILACYRDEELRKLGEPKQAELVYPHYGKGKLYRATCVVKAPDEERTFEQAVEERIATVLKGIESETFAPSPHADCKWCKFKPVCPMWPEGQELQVR
ncbi:MAG TPA: ATP-dependent DNA helicase, partial [Actinomycetota bacterium]|nr:ATP-dependent DNA helicase [Actinomycetota bacterium]